MYICCTLILSFALDLCNINDTLDVAITQHLCYITIDVYVFLACMTSTKQLPYVQKFLRCINFHEFCGISLAASTPSQSSSFYPTEPYQINAHIKAVYCLTSFMIYVLCIFYKSSLCNTHHTSTLIYSCSNIWGLT